MLLLLHSAAASAPRRLVDLTPLKGMLLMQRWQASTDARNLVTTIPDGNKLKAVRALQGDEPKQLLVIVHCPATTTTLNKT